MSRHTSPKVDCPKCNGHGKISLSNVLLEVMGVFKRRRDEFSASQVRNLIGEGVSVNAINNRLEDLRALNFLQRRRDGHQWKYRTNEKHRTPSRKPHQSGRRPTV